MWSELELKDKNKKPSLSWIGDSSKFLKNFRIGRESTVWVWVIMIMLNPNATIMRYFLSFDRNAFRPKFYLWNNLLLDELAQLTTTFIMKHKKRDPFSRSCCPITSSCCCSWSGCWSAFSTSSVSVKPQSCISFKRHQVQKCGGRLPFGPTKFDC